MLWSVTKRLATLACALALLLPPAALAGELPPGGTFVDDDTSVHQGWIEAIAAAGITKGCNAAGDRFCPDEPISRGQMAALIARALPVTAISAHDGFVDTTDSVFRADINRIARAGITRGCNPPHNDRFCPLESVTRGQMAAFLQRALGYPPSESDRFRDDDASVFEPAIEAIAAMGVTAGCNATGDLFCPDRLVTRAEMATFLGRALGLAAIVVPPRPIVVDVVPREGWGALPATGTFAGHDIDHITVHHAGSAHGTTGPAQFRGWQAWHRHLGWGDIAYHFIIGRDGLVYEGRAHTVVGATATEYDPTGHFLVVVEGNFDESTPTPEQLEMLARMVAWGSRQFGVPVAEAMGHRDHASTTCPGDALYAAIHDGSLEARASTIVDAGGVDLVVGG